MRLLTAVFPALALGVLAHAVDLHVVVDSVQGVLIGVAIVGAYLAALRWIDRSRSGDGSRHGASSTERERRDR